VPALWNIADAYGVSSNVVGWWITWPVEEVQGVMVAASSSAALVAENWKPTLLPGVPDQVHPEALTDEVMALAAEAGGLEQVQELARARVFGTEGMDALDPRDKRSVQQTLWSVQSDATFAKVAASVFAEHPADLNLVYFGGPDVSGHRFWRQYQPEGFAWSGRPESDAALADVIPNSYEWVDELVGEMIAAMGREATVLIVSDHGMRALPSAKKAPPSGMANVITGHHMQGEPGVIIAAGPGIARQGGLDAFDAGDALKTKARVTSVAPLVLALLGIPSAKDFVDRSAPKDLLEGKALENAGLPPVASHASGFRRPEMVEMPAEMRRERPTPMSSDYTTRPFLDDEDDDEEDERSPKIADFLGKNLLDHRIIMVAKPVDRELMAQITSQLLVLDAKDPKKPITMYINCPGGDADSGFGIYDAMRLISAPVVTVCAGLAASAAIIIFLGGSKGKRYATPNSRFLIHQPSTRAQGAASDLEITANEIVKLREQYNTIIGGETGTTAKQVERGANRDFWLTAQEAVDYGLASGIVETLKGVK
jgi:ATP-dependent Clp protease protease subunit